MSIYKLLLGALLMFTQNIVAQNSIKILTEKKGISLRGLSLPSKKVIWASGSKGSVVRSVDGGNSFEWLQVKGYEQRDFRAIHAWNEQEAIIVAIAAPAYILKTKNGGANWYKVYENADTAMFLDAIQFKDDTTGFVVGDPINNHIFLLTTNNKGENWTAIPNEYFKSKLKEGEAFFASSSSNIAQSNNNQFLVTGGLASRLWINGEAMNIPIIQGKKSTGANSIAISPNGNTMLIVGGDFAQDSLSTQNIVKLSRISAPKSNLKHYANKKERWVINPAISNPFGYKSCVSFLNNNLALVCGTSGIALSKNNGKTWQNISNMSFHVVKKQPNTKNAFFAGSGGKIGVAFF